MPLILFNFDWQVTGCLEIMIDLDNFPALSERIEHVWTSKYGNHDLIRQGRALNMGYCYQVEIKIPFMEITTLFTEFKKHFSGWIMPYWISPETAIFPYLAQNCPKSALGANFCHQSVSKPIRFIKFDCHFWNQLSLKFSEHIYFDMWILSIFLINAGLFIDYREIFGENMAIFGHFLLIFYDIWAKFWIFMIWKIVEMA